jgi:hypothetical protein
MLRSHGPSHRAVGFPIPGGNDYGNGGHGNYTIENIGNGSFEVKWTSHGCIADYDRHGNSTGYTNCNGDMKRRSDEIARQRAR